MTDPSDARPTARKRAPPPLTVDYLHDQARRHLLRFEPTVFQMRRVLMRRVDTAIAWHGGDRAQGAHLVSAVLADLIERGWLNDERVARAWVDTLHRRGVPSRAMRARLSQKGLDHELIARVLSELTQDHADPDLEAAFIYARRRRFGPYRTTQRAERRERDLAAMARAGFPFPVCLRVIDAADLPD